MKSFAKVLSLAVCILTSILFFTKTAHAAIITFDVFDHPDWYDHHNPTQAGGIFASPQTGWQIFHFESVLADFDTVAGTAHMYGTLYHFSDPSQAWYLDSVFSNPEPAGGFIPSSPLPNDLMFDELMNSIGRIDWPESTYVINLTPLVPNPIYGGPGQDTVLHGHMMPAELYRYQPGVFEFHEWFLENGDIHVLLKNGRPGDNPNIPEPGSLLLFGSSLLACRAFGIRRRTK